MQRAKFTVLNSNREELINMIRKAPSGTELELTFGDAHSMVQRAKMRCLLRDIAKQATWCGVKMPEDLWKNLFTAELHRELMYPDLHGGGYVLMGDSTKDMTVTEMSGMIDLMQAFGIEQSIEFKGDYEVSPKQAAG